VSESEAPRAASSASGAPRPEDQDVQSFEAERLPRALVLLIPLAAALAALPGLFGPLLADDYVLLARLVDRPLSEVARAVFWPTAAVGAYRPLTELSIALDAALWGGAPFGLHLGNLLWHVACALLCSALVRALVPPRPVVALVAGLLFASHPVHGDAIFQVGARADLLVTCLMLASLILFLRGGGVDRRRRPTLASLAVFAAALLCKESALVLPLLVVLLDLAAPTGERLGRRLRAGLPRYLWYAGVLAAYVAFRLVVVRGAPLRLPGLGEALFAVGLSLKLLLLPVETHSGVRGGVVLALSVITLVVAFLRYARMGDRRNMLLASVWTVLLLMPLLDEPRRVALYLPSTGLCVFFGIVLGGLVWRRDQEHPVWVRRVGAGGLLLLLVGGVGVLAYHATVYRRAGALAQRLVAQLLEARRAAAPAAREVAIANLPAALTSWAGDQPLFAAGFPEALRLVDPGLEARVLSTLYVKDGATVRPRARRVRDGALLLEAGESAAFSFHRPELTTGRDRPRVGQELELVGWSVRLEAVERGRVTRLRVTARRPPGPVFAWTGARVELVR
jgi:hypothetical protein